MDPTPIEPTEPNSSTSSDVASLIGTVTTVLVGRWLVVKGYHAIGNRAVRKANKAQKKTEGKK